MKVVQCSNTGIAQMIGRLAALRFQRKEIEREEKKLKPLLRQHMQGAKIDKLITDTGHFATLEKNSRSYLDENAICEALKIDDLKVFRYQKEITSRLKCEMPVPSKRMGAVTRKKNQRFQRKRK